MLIVVSTGLVSEGNMQKCQSIGLQCMKLNILGYNFWILQAWLVTLKCSSGEVHRHATSFYRYRWSAQYMPLLFN